MISFQKSKIYIERNISGVRMHIRFALIILLLGSVAIFAADDAKKEINQSDRTRLNPDGSIGLIPYNVKQQQRIDSIAKEVDEIHGQINEKLKFLNFEKKIKDSRYGQVSSAREIKLPYEPSYVQHSRYVMKLKGGGGAEGGGFALDEISFWSRKSLISKGKEPLTIYRDLKNSASGGGIKGLTLSIRTVTNADDSTSVYELEKIQSPWERIQLAIAYRNRLTDVLRTIDRYISGKGFLEAKEVKDSILEISIGGDFQEP